MANSVRRRNSAIRESTSSGADFKKSKPTDFQPVSSQPSPSRDAVELKDHESLAKKRRDFFMPQIIQT